MSDAVPKERFWVGSIVTLLEIVIEEEGIEQLAQSSIVVHEDDKSLAQLGWLVKPGEYRRFCHIVNCDKLQEVISVHSWGEMLSLNMVLHDLAFEICHRMEPRWEEIIRGSAEPVGDQMTEAQRRENDKRLVQELQAKYSKFDGWTKDLPPGAANR